MRISHKGQKIITIDDLFKGKNETRRLMAHLSFPEKIRMLVSLQETALKWGGKKDVIMWKI